MFVCFALGLGLLVDFVESEVVCLDACLLLLFIVDDLVVFCCKSVCLLVIGVGSECVCFGLVGLIGIVDGCLLILDDLLLAVYLLCILVFCLVAVDCLFCVGIICLDLFGLYL